MRTGYVRLVASMMRFLRITTAVLLLLSVLLNFANVVGRYVLHAPIIGAEEVMLYLMTAIVFLGCGTVAWEGRHIKMDILLDRLPAPAQHAIRVVIEFSAIVVAAIIINYAVPVIVHLAMFNERSEAANVPLAIPEAFVPIGFAVLILGTSARLLDPTQRLGAHDIDMLEDN